MVNNRKELEIFTQKCHLYFIHKSFTGFTRIEKEFEKAELIGGLNILGHIFAYLRLKLKV